MRKYISQGVERRLSELIWRKGLFQSIVAPSQSALSQSLGEVETILEDFIYANIDDPELKK
jgi:hypothetical protein